MSYTREQAEEVMKDWNAFHLGSSDFTKLDHKFLDHKFPKLPERGWLKHRDGSIIFRTGGNSGYGLDKQGGWETGIDDYAFDRPQEWQPATKEEVQSMIKKEAERRGLVKGAETNGVRTISLYQSKRMTIENAYDPAWDNRLMEHGELWGVNSVNVGIFLMKDGIWATPIDDLQERIDKLIQEAKEKGKNLTIKID